jgi:phosphoribosylglycinamide formyltransferase-1
MMRIAALASHGGSILQAVIDAIETGTLDAELVLIASNNSNAHALQRAGQHNIPTIHLSSQTHPNPEALDAAMAEAFTSAQAQWLLLAGYMKKLGPTTLTAFHRRILNTHPSLLPKYGGKGYYGIRVHEAVLAAGERETGATVHLVEDDYDTGPIVSQVRVRVKAQDIVEALQERVKAAERKLIVTTLAQLAESREAAGYS